MCCDVILITISIMNLKILLFEINVNIWSDTQVSNKKVVLYYQYIESQQYKGVCKSRELCDIKRIKELCDVTHDFTNTKSLDDFIFIHDGRDVAIYERFCLINVAKFYGVEHMRLEHHKMIDKCKSHIQSREIRFDDVMNINDYKIVEIIYDDVRFFDVLIMLPTINSLCECYNYDGIICSINMLKRNQIVNDVVIIIIKMIGFMNIFQTYCEQYYYDKKTKREIFPQNHIEDIAFKHAFKRFVHKFIYDR